MYLTIGIIAAAALLAFGFWASFSVAGGVYLHCFCREAAPSRRVALTFDDGPDAAMTPRVLDVLKRHGAKATFFLVGRQAAEQPALVRRIVAEGHAVGNHTYSHDARYPFFGRRRIAEELERSRRTLEEITGGPVRLFRPPFGVTNPTIAAAVKSGGYTAVGWSVRSFDTLGRTPREKVVRQVVRRLHGGAVVLLHDRCPGADEVLEAILTQLEQQGYEPVTIDEMIHANDHEK